ncbi:MAG: glycosyltransferase family 4 protein [Dehalococcoidia bacterium]
MKRRKMAHLISHPIHYFAPLYRELASRPEIDLTVHFYSDAPLRGVRDEQFDRTVAWDARLLDGYAHRFAANASSTPARASDARPQFDVARDVLRGGYDVVWAHGYAHATTWLAMLAAHARGARLLIRDEQTLLHERPPYRRFARSLALRQLFTRSHGLYIGEENRRFMRAHGMRDDRMFAARYCVDNAYFQERATALAPRRADVRASFGIDDDAPVVLFVGKLIDKKQPLRAIEAFASVRAALPCWLLIAGDGPLRDECEALVARLDVPNVRFAGFLDQGEVPRAYAAADVFVLPSNLHETWGLVVNEAMNFALPVVVSDKVGCAADLVRPRENGVIVAADRTGQLVDAFAALVRDAGMRRAYGARSREIVSDYSIEAAADGIVAACTAEEARRTAWKREASTAGV